MPVTSGEHVLDCTVKDLHVNCEYYFRVKAVNKVGAGAYLELRTPVIIEEIKRKSTSGQSTWPVTNVQNRMKASSIPFTEKPDPPIQVEGQEPTSKSITITWKAPDYDGGCPIQGYIVERMEKDGERYERVTPNLVPGFSHVVTGLEEDKEYLFRVRAENAAGISGPSRSTQPIRAADPVGMTERFANSCT